MNRFIQPHCPWQNGEKVERFNRTLAIEWAYRRPYLTNAARTAALAPWLEHYNTARRHSALGGRPTHQSATNLMADRTSAADLKLLDGWPS